MSDFLAAFDNPSTFGAHYLNVEVTRKNEVRLFLNDEARKFVKKHSELLDCLK